MASSAAVAWPASLSSFRRRVRSLALRAGSLRDAGAEGGEFGADGVGFVGAVGEALVGFGFLEGGDLAVARS